MIKIFEIYFFISKISFLNIRKMIPLMRVEKIKKKFACQAHKSGRILPSTNENEKILAKLPHIKLSIVLQRNSHLFWFEVISSVNCTIKTRFRYDWLAPVNFLNQSTGEELPTHS